MDAFPIKVGPTVEVQFAQRFDFGVHEGTDVFAPAGAEVVAVEDGKIRHATEKNGGKVVYLTTPNKTQYYYSHLDAWAGPMQSGKTRDVKAGDVLGYVGTSGNAKGGPPHLHFEMRPFGGSKVDPFPFLNSVSAVMTPNPLVTTPKPQSRPTQAASSSSSSGPSWGMGVGILLLAWALSQRGGKSWL